ncbi:hypothetical protein ASF83_07670 [Plantibacter sp. Leaf171]|uniref:MGMT family protein n=1 Tax=unclassified Plantibacter TaxID=2624265 RepID=UPI0006F372F0|nr:MULTISPECIES: MGMT family protein [unclassified Plantibacter]KQM15796.1 hypothetical protein ASE44_07685 [Plantibacter sp. Leaf1]KQR58939.1 hypothetical protein ASF83_07670 [Plantibacter sp. Leaf171]
MGGQPAINTAEAFAEAVLAVVADIPEGCALSYGQVAAIIGSRSARGVGRVMAQYGHAVPWWRVVRSGGLPPTGHEERALEHYEAEGTPIVRMSGGRYRLGREALLH